MSDEEMMSWLSGHLFPKTFDKMFRLRSKPRVRRRARCSIASRKKSLGLFLIKLLIFSLEFVKRAWVQTVDIWIWAVGIAALVWLSGEYLAR